MSWRARVAEYLTPFAPERYRTAFCAAVLDGVAPTDDGVKHR